MNLCYMRLRIALLLLAAITCAAQTSRDKEPLCDQQPTKRVDVSDADAAILGLAISRASLKDVQAKLGKATIERVSRDEESDTAICYLSPADGTVLVFYSGAMGGWTDITHFALWSRAAMYPHRSQCTASTLVSQNVATASGLRLGLTQKQLEEIAGKPTKSGAVTSKYEYLCRRKMTADEINRFKDANNWDATSDAYFDRMSWINVRYARSLVSRIEVGRIESD